MRNYICNGDKFAYDEKGYIYLPIPTLDNLPPILNIEGETLLKKSKFHISLVCVKNILAENSIANLEQLILNSFCKFSAEHDISFTGFSGEMRLAKSEERMSVVARCNISNLNKFSESFSKELNIDIPTQPTHLTLYTLQPDAGIGLNSPEEWEAKSTPIQLPSEILAVLGIS